MPREVTMNPSDPSGDYPSDKKSGVPDRGFHGEPGGQQSCSCSGKSAASAVYVLHCDPSSAELCITLFRHEYIHRVTRKMSSLDQYCFHAHADNYPAGLYHILRIRNCCPGKYLRFVDIWSAESAQW